MAVMRGLGKLLHPPRGARARLGLLFVCLLGCSGERAASSRATEASLPGDGEAAGDPRPGDVSPTDGHLVPQAPESGVLQLCQRYGEPTPGPTLPPEVPEASGLVVVGPADAPIFWLNNDSGDMARLYAVDRTGALLTTVLLDSVIALDWEDLAAGPCAPDEDEPRCLYVGDIGDNYRLRRRVPIYRLPLPATQPDFQRLTDGLESMRVSYPDGAHDCEALVVDEHARVYLFTKDRDGTFSVYSASFTPGESVTLDYHGTVDISDLPGGNRATVTAADYDPVGRRLLLRTYNAAIEYRLDPGESIEDLGAHERTVVPTANERQGESIAYGVGGYWHVSEGEGPPLYFVPCQ